MSQKRRKYSPAFRARALKLMENCANVSALARRLGIRPKFLCRWRDQAREAALGAPSSENEEEELLAQVADLQRLVGQQTAAIDFSRAALRRIEDLRQRKSANGGAASTSRSSRCNRKAN